MADDRPVLHQLNLVVRDMDKTIEFYETLGVKVSEAPTPWDRHHRTASTPSGLDFDLDSSTFAALWNRGWPTGQAGPVIGFRVASREAVDRTFQQLTDMGHRSQQEPYDAFWGARYAIVTDPDGNAVGIMSPVDPERRSPPPTPPDA